MYYQEVRSKPCHKITPVTYSKPNPRWFHKRRFQNFVINFFAFPTLSPSPFPLLPPSSTPLIFRNRYSDSHFPQRVSARKANPSTFPSRFPLVQAQASGRAQPIANEGDFYPADVTRILQHLAVTIWGVESDVAGFSRRLTRIFGPDSRFRFRSLSRAGGKKSHLQRIVVYCFFFRSSSTIPN